MESATLRNEVILKHNQIHNINQYYGNGILKPEETTDNPIFFKIKEPIYSFTGRKEDLITLNKSVLENVITVVSGFGGIGKTELIRFYAWNQKNQFNILWINAESESSLKSSFQQLAAELRIESIFGGIERSIDEIIREIYNKLNKRKVLIVFDNAINRIKTQKYLPETSDKTIKVLISSQNRDWKKDYVIELSVWNAEDACKFLRNNLHESCNTEEKEKDVERLAKELQYLPLALQQAVAYINYKILDLDEEFSVLKYIEEYERKKVFDFHFEGNLPFPDCDVNSYDKTLFQSVTLSVDLIKTTATCPDLTLDILHLCSYLAPDNIPKSIFNPLEKDDEDSLNNCLYVLTKYSLLQKFRNEDEWFYNIHRLVQLSYRYIKNPNGFCEETSKKTMLLTTNNIFLNLDHYTYVLDFIMKKVYFDSEITEEILDYKVCYYVLLKTMPFMLEDFVDAYRTIDDGTGNEDDYTTLSILKSLIENFYLKHLQIETDFFGNPTNEAANQLFESLVPVFLDAQQSGSNLLKKDLSVALAIASCFGYLKIVEYVKDRGVNINTPMQFDEVNRGYYQFNGATPLFIALQTGRLHIAQYLIDNGADVNKANINLETPLHAAACNGHYEIVQLLLEKGCDVNVLSENKLSALFYAAYEGRLNIVEYLIKNGANINETNSTGRTPLHEAAENGQYEIVQFLVENKCDINVLCADKQSALFYATNEGHLKIVEYLIKNGADINGTNITGRTPLHEAAFNGPL